MITISIRACVLSSSSSGNSVYVETQELKILVDAGFSGKMIAQKLCEIDVNIKDIDALLLTHEHIDHIKGAGVLARRFKIPIYANEGTWAGIGDGIGKISSEQCLTFSNDKLFSLKDLQVKPYAVSHDAQDTVGFSFFHDEYKISIATDLGYVDERIIHHLAGSDGLILEANHDKEMLKVGPYPWPVKQRILSDRGHLSNEVAGHALCCLLEKKIPQVLLAHLSQNNNLPELAMLTIKNILAQQGCEVGKDIDVSLSYCNRPSKIMAFG